MTDNTPTASAHGDTDTSVEEVRSTGDTPTGADPTVGERSIRPDRPVLEPTGDPGVDAVLEEFDRVTGEPLATHVEAAERVHDALQSRLSDLGDG